MGRILRAGDRVSRFAEKNWENKKEFGEDARLAFKRHLDDLKRSERQRRPPPSWICSSF